MAGKIGIINIASSREIFDRYVFAVEAAGGVPAELAPSPSLDEVNRQAEQCDAFVFIGGPDFSPGRYGGSNHPSIVKLLDDVAEEYCFALSKAVVFEQKKPCLGICLGCQLLNIIYGGTLYEDLHSQVPGAYWHARYKGFPKLENMHRVTFTEKSPLHDIFGCDWLCVNSSHHQAVRKLGTGLSVGAISDDGIVEAICGPDMQRHFVLGLQWHPERLFDKVYGHLKVFERLVACSR